jgi:hypothetical protein
MPKSATVALPATPMMLKTRMRTTIPAGSPLRTP